jgi:ubiquinone/menaquinone biosynthesis C-methylase UbiE
MHHKTADTPKTAGRVIHRGARWYDLFGTVISFGRDKAIREKLIELAKLAPGEKVLDVGCARARSLSSSSGRWAPARCTVSTPPPEMVQFAKEKSAKDGSDIDF